MEEITAEDDGVSLSNNFELLQALLRQYLHELLAINLTIS